MTPTRDAEAAEAFTRASVEVYLRAAAAERAHIEGAIVRARQRTAQALLHEQHLMARPGLSDENGNGSLVAADPSDEGAEPAAAGLAGGPGDDPFLAQLRLTPGSEDIWPSAQVSKAMAHE